MKAILILGLIFCMIWESDQGFYRSQPDVYVTGGRIPGDELIYRRLHTLSPYTTDAVILYPSKSAFVSFYKISRIEFKDYDENYHVNYTGDINDYRIKLEIYKNDTRKEQSFIVWIYGKYVGPCKKQILVNYCPLTNN